MIKSNRLYQQFVAPRQRCLSNLCYEAQLLFGKDDFVLG
ncbi:hypothetical protein PMIT1327_01779 [Prochlorococcus marinus str. MIT 1327]|nr:hypothetical protein PMIT1312_02532 [Prochlorococcus marinus str. MIT 1312]KZR79719.1 hypothetical protein PMIT1327_01779 [Prochlorococcus marinus str. MIT 1327]